MEVNELLTKATSGDLASIETVAESYFRGKNGFDEDNDQALIWYQKALEIDPNNKIALTGIGSIYYKGYGVPVDKDKGLAFYLKGADVGSGKSAARLGDHFKELQDTQCISWYEKAFSLGEAAAAYELYRLYADGEFVAVDTAKQLEWLEKGAEANNSDCQLALACEYLPNGNCEQDYSLALKWMQAAAENGSGVAMTNLAIMYTNGDGVEKDYDIALEWAIKGAKNGDASQLNRYALYYQDGTGFLPHMPGKAIELLQIGVDAGDRSSMVFLANTYLQGLGVEADETKALPLLEAAAKQGDKTSLRLIKEIEPHIYGEDASAKYYEVVKEGADNGYYACMVCAYQCLSSGEGVGKDPEAAIKYLEEAACDDYKEAVFYLGAEHMSGDLLKDANPKTAVELFEKVISLGEQDETTAAAQRNLGLMYKEGIGVDQDLEKAITYLESAADNGNIDALLKAALAHDSGGWADLDYEKACSYYAKLAEVGHAGATTCLAYNYEHGLGVPKDFGKAAELYEKAIQLGDPRAMTNLALLYQNEEAIGKDEKRAVELLAEAAKQGYPQAEVLLGFAYYEGKGVSTDLGEALKLWETAAEQGDSTAQNLLGTAYADKSFESFIDYNRAVAYFRPLAEQGDVEAACHLADSLEKIYAWDEAKEWYRKAAEAGNVEAQFQLGMSAYLHEDYVEAARWTQPAAEQGHLGAMNVMADMLFYGYGPVQQDQAKSCEYYIKTAELGNTHGLYRAGRCFYLGVGTGKDKSRAFKYFLQARERGSNEMWFELGNCFFVGDGVEQNIPEAIKCYEKGVETTDCKYCRNALGQLYADTSSGYFNRSLAEKYLMPLLQDQEFKADAAFRLGMLCGNSGDIQGSVRWYTMASDENHAVAQYNLGVIYFNGELGSRDLDRAEQYFTMAARNGHPDAASDAADCRALKVRMQAQSQQSSQTTSSSAPQKSGGCYIATAVYGSYDCPEVWTLRRFRDFTLAETWYGRLFIWFYYSISPTFVRIFGKCNWFKTMWRPILDEMVDKLRHEGFEDTPYNDRKY